MKSAKAMAKNGMETNRIWDGKWIWCDDDDDDDGGGGKVKRDEILKLMYTKKEREREKESSGAKPFFFFGKISTQSDQTIPKRTESLPNVISMMSPRLIYHHILQVEQEPEIESDTLLYMLTWQFFSSSIDIARISPMLRLWAAQTHFNTTQSKDSKFNQ